MEETLAITGLLIMGWLALIMPAYWLLQLICVIEEARDCHQQGGYSPSVLRYQALSRLEADRFSKAVVAFVWPVALLGLVADLVFNLLPRKVYAWLLEQYLKQLEKKDD